MPKPANIWFVDTVEGVGQCLKVRQRLFAKESKYQCVEVVDTEQYGRVLLIDSMVMSSEWDECNYHEMMVHPAMFVHKDPKRVLIVGGGDGGTLREVVRHEDRIERVDMVEIDEVVIEATRACLPTLAVAFDHPKANIIIADAIEWAKKAPGKAYDVILVDGADPVGPAVGLFEAPFLQDLRRILKDDGIIVMQTESPAFLREHSRRVFRVYRELFGRDHVWMYLTVVPSYPCGWWTFAFCSPTYDPIRDFDEQRARSVDWPLRYYSPEVHKAAFVVPRMVRQEILGEA